MDASLLTSKNGFEKGNLIEFTSDDEFNPTRWGIFDRVENFQGDLILCYDKVGTVFCDKIISIRVLSWPWCLWSNPTAYQYAALDDTPPCVVFWTEEELDALTDRKRAMLNLYKKPFWAE